MINISNTYLLHTLACFMIAMVTLPSLTKAKLNDCFDYGQFSGKPNPFIIKTVNITEPFNDTNMTVSQLVSNLT